MTTVPLVSPSSNSPGRWPSCWNCILDGLPACMWLRYVNALRAKPYSPRAYFLLNAPPDIRQRAKQIASDWPGL